MGTVADKLNKLLSTKADIRAAITEKGQTVAEADTFASYADKIRAIETASKGMEWTVFTAIGANNYSIAYGDGVFVVVEWGHNVMSYSIDGGKTWNKSNSLLESQWRSVAYGDGVFVAVPFCTIDGSTVSFARSADRGKNWLLSNIETNIRKWNSITYGNKVFVAVGESDQAIYSTDKGISWNLSTLPSSNWSSIAYGGGVFVAVGNGGKCAYSTNEGKTWTSVTIENYVNYSSVAYGGGVFVATGSAHPSYSTDFGKTWTYCSSGGINAESIAYGGGVFVEVGYDRSAYSTDGGKTWGGIITLNDMRWRTVAYGGGTFVAMSYGRRNAAYVSIIKEL